MRKGSGFWVSVFALLLTASAPASAAIRKAHSVVLGAVRHEPYSKEGDPSGAAAGETSLEVRALLVDGVLKEWTTGEAHDVTERSFVVRRAIRMNNALPGDTKEQWVWQRGPWLLVDRATGHITPLKLPDYDPGVSQVVWFRDYGAYCGVTASGKSLYAVVAQIAARKAVLAKKLSAFDAKNHAEPVCVQAEWRRDPMRVTFHPAGTDAVSYDIAAGSAVLVEGSGDDDAPAESPAATAGKPGTAAPATPPAQHK
ncbi:MAG: hypothetical protein ACRD3N_07410 [Terracidiphilus sp.]